MKNETFLTEEQEQHIVDAIADAENRTSGEIRVHIEHHTDREPLERAGQIFHELGMDETELQNGVLIYIATEDKKAAVYAGKGIHKQVGENYWNEVLKIILDHFRKGEFEEGIADAVGEVADKLKEFFPYRQEDTNELSDEISYHENKKE